MFFTFSEKPNGALGLTRRAGLLALTLLLGACASGPSETAGTSLQLPAEASVGEAAEELGALSDPLQQIKVAQQKTETLRQGVPRVLPGLRPQSLPTNAQPGKVEMQVLVLYAGAADSGLASAQALLGQHGVPFTALDTTTQPLNHAALIGGDGVGRYAGVILTTAGLSTELSPGVYGSTLDSGEWATLFEYEALYGVRQLALFGYPSTVPEDYGLRPVSGAEGASADLTLTGAGRQVFSDLTAGPLPIRNAYHYPATLQTVPGVTTTPLLTDSQGRIVAALSTGGGRERLLITAAQNPYLLHTQLLGPGLVHWLMKGVYVGEYRRYLQVDIDDWFLYADRYDPATGQVVPRSYRLTAADALSLRKQQNTIRSRFAAVAPDFRLAQAFNGFGADAAAPNTCTPDSTVKDPLSAVTRCIAKNFDWVNHTRDHLLLDRMAAPELQTQLEQNIQIATALGLPLSRRALVTPEHSGLGWFAAASGQPKMDFGLAASNPELLKAARQQGMRYIASNHSVPSQWNSTCPNCGVFHPLDPSLLLVPRWPNSVAYTATTPDEAAGQYNAVYGPGGVMPYWPKNLNYQEFLSQDINMSLIHVLNGTAWPHYMHQGNQREYTPNRSLVSDWVTALLERYSSHSTLPLLTLKWNQLGSYVEDRTLFEQEKKNVKAVWDRTTGQVQLTYKGPQYGDSMIYVTGAEATGIYRDEYAGRTISQLNVGSRGATLQVVARP